MTKLLVTQRKLIEILLQTPVVEVAVKRVGIARSTYYRWHKADPGFAEAVDSAIEQSCALVNDMAESQLIGEIRAKNMTAIIFWLKHRHAGYRNKLELSGKIVADTDTLTLEQEIMVKQALLHAGLVNTEVSNDPESKS